MENDTLKATLAQEMQELLKKERIAVDLIDMLDFNFQWLFRFCERNHIEIPDRERIYRSLNRVRELTGELATITHDDTQGEITQRRYRILIIP